jgi:hypothetical protein
LKWLGLVAVIEALAIRIAGLILILLLLANAIAHEWHGLMATIFNP